MLSQQQRRAYREVRIQEFKDTKSCQSMPVEREPPIDLKVGDGPDKLKPDANEIWIRKSDALPSASFRSNLPRLQVALSHKNLECFKNPQLGPGSYDCTADTSRPRSQCNSKGGYVNSAAIRLHSLIDLESQRQKKKPTFKKSVKEVETPARPSLSLVKSNTQKCVAPFGKSQVERDLNHWRDIKKYVEYRDTPGPQHDYQNIVPS